MKLLNHELLFNYLWQLSQNTGRRGQQMQCEFFRRLGGHLHSFASREHTLQNLIAVFQKVSEHMNKRDLASTVYLDF